MESVPHKNFTHEHPPSFLHVKFNQPTSTLKLKHTTTHEINNMIQSLSTKNSCGYDEISSGILKLVPRL